MKGQNFASQVDTLSESQVKKEVIFFYHRGT